MTERMDKALIASGNQDPGNASEAQVQGTVGVGMAMGVAAGSVGFGGMQKQKKYQLYFFVCAILFATIMLFSLPFSSEPSEDEEDDSKQPFKWEAFSMFWDGEYTGAVWGLFWYTFFGRLSSGIVAQLVAPILEEDTIYGYEKDQTGKIFGMMGFMFLLGCGVAGLLKPKFGATLTGATATLVIGGIMMSMVASLNLFIVGLLIVLFSGGVINVISAACLMILSEPEINASFFAIAMITQNAGNVVSRFITGPLVDSGRDANGRVILTRDKAVFALYVAVGIGSLGLLAIPMIWTGINKRMAERQRIAEGGAPAAKESGQDDQQGNSV